MKKLNICSLALTLALTVSLAVPVLAADPPGFSDVPASHTFYSGIMYCAERGVINGYEDGTFRPSNTVTRMNFIVMLSRAFYPDDVVKYTTPSDLKYGKFMPNWVALNYNYILKNTSFSTFSDFQNSATINAGISRYDMAMLMTNIMSQKGFTASTDQKNAAIANIADYNSIPSQYKDAVLNVYALGIIGGYPNGTFSGSATMNRGQAAIVIHRMTEKSGIDIQKPTTNPETPVNPGTDTPVSDPEPSTPSVSTGNTLVDGSEITEANVMRLMEARIAEWGNKKWGEHFESSIIENVYPAGNGGDVATTVKQYRRSDGYTTSCSDGCGGWATYLSDAAFGNRNFPMRKTTFENMRAGDIVIILLDGKLTHVAVASGRITTASFNNHAYTIDYKGVYTTNAGTIPGKHDRYLHANDERVLNYDSTTGKSVVIYTRYPE